MTREEKLKYCRYYRGLPDEEDVFDGQSSYFWRAEKKWLGWTSEEEAMWVRSYEGRMPIDSNPVGIKVALWITCAKMVQGYVDQFEESIYSPYLQGG